MSTDSSTDMSAAMRGTETFGCVRCGLTATAYAPDGARRDHCPSCLHSLHVDDHVAGGASSCRSRMTPIAIAVPRAGGWMLVHRCAACAELTASQVRGDDNRLVLMRLAVRPLADPPFPLETFGDL